MTARGTDCTAAGKAKERTEKENDKDWKELTRWRCEERDTRGSCVPTERVRKEIKGNHPSDILRVRWESQRTTEGFKQKSCQDLQACAKDSSVCKRYGCGGGDMVVSGT